MLGILYHTPLPPFTPLCASKLWFHKQKKNTYFVFYKAIVLKSYSKIEAKRTKNNKTWISYSRSWNVFSYLPKPEPRVWFFDFFWAENVSPFWIFSVQFHLMLLLAFEWTETTVVCLKNLNYFFCTFHRKFGQNLSISK